MHTTSATSSAEGVTVVKTTALQKSALQAWHNQTDQNTITQDKVHFICNYILSVIHSGVTAMNSWLHHGGWEEEAFKQAPWSWSIRSILHKRLSYKWLVPVCK